MHWFTELSLIMVSCMNAGAGVRPVLQTFTFEDKSPLVYKSSPSMQLQGAHAS